MENNYARIKLKSNIILKSMYLKKPDVFKPMEILPREYWDVRSEIGLSSEQKKQIEKHLYYANRIVDEEESQNEEELLNYRKYR